MSNYITESVKDTAAKVRKALADAFPGIKFSVRAERGSSVRVNWIDGPRADVVRAVADKFQSARMDLYQDLATLPGYEQDGQTIVGARWVCCRRELSDAYAKQLTDFTAKHYPSCHYSRVLDWAEEHMGKDVW